MADSFQDHLPGAEGATIGRISEILRGATLVGIWPEKAQDRYSGGEILRIDFSGGDYLLIAAAPVSPLERARGDADVPLTARLRPVLVTSRGTRLKWT